jgi:uncharacterized membrane protein
MQYAVAYLAAFVTMLVLDGVWLGLVAVDFYRAQIGHLMTDDIRYGAAALFYVSYVAGVVFFVVRPALAARSRQVALIHGAFFGFIAYMTYDLTNLATLRGWPVVVAVADLAWGCFITAAMAAAGYAAATRVRR